MSQMVELPLWLFVLIVLFAAVTFASHFLFPSVRWFFRRRLEKAVTKLNTRLTRPIEPFKLAHRYDMIQRLSYDPQVSEAIVEYARKERVPENVAFEKARRYAREIVPSFSAFTYFGFGIRFARFLANTLYTVRTGPDNEKVIASVSPDATVVFIMNHRSNMDYVLVTYLAARASALSYAVGEWARIWPLSRLIKSMGAYFIRRRSRGALYRRVLSRYVHLATEGGVTQAIFPEGGLSLDGRLAPPKMGLLTYVVEAGRAVGRDVVFIPVAINYDRVLEDRVLMAAHKRGDRRFGAKISVVLKFILEKLWLRMRGRFLRFGSAGVVFGDPISMQAFGVDRRVEDLAETLMSRIQDVMPRMCVPVLAKGLLATDEPQARQKVIDVAVQAIVAAPESFLMGDDEDPKARVERAVAHMIQRGLIRPQGDLFEIPDQERDTLQYYANSLDLPDAPISAPAK
ncbi:MAG: 1-acyl-sn-glycerol-3-phosphate acyltransferase [Aliishimia sp.]